MENVSAKKNYRELRTEPQFIKNMIAGIINRFGDSIDAIAYTWLVYAVSGSASLTAVTYGVNTLISVLFQPFTSAMITNMNKKALLVVTDMGRGLLVALTALLYILGVLRPWMLIATTALMSTLEAFRLPAGMAVLPDILSRDKYSLGTSLNQSLQRIAEIIGMGAAGAIIGLIGSSGALIVDAATFFVSAGILFTLKLPKHEKVKSESKFREFTKNTREGFSYAARNKLILAICLGACLINFAFVPYSSLQTAYVNESLKLGPEALSVIGVASSAGMALGAFFFPKISAKVKRYYLFFVGVTASAACYVGMSAIPLVTSEILRWVLIAALMLVFGVALGLTNTSVSVSFMENVEKEYLARVNGIMSAMCMAAMPVGSFLVAAVAAFFPVNTLIFGFGLIALAACCCIPFIKIYRKL